MKISISEKDREMKINDIVHPQGKLGIDLPDTEDALFAISHYPLFDMELAVDIFQEVKHL